MTREHEQVERDGATPDVGLERRQSLPRASSEELSIIVVFLQRSAGENDKTRNPRTRWRPGIVEAEAVS
jgi:hypothetical protein